MSSLQQSTNAFDALPIRQAVFRQTFPAIASQMITLIYNLADTYFVGMLNQPSQTAAITVVYSSFLMLTAISNLFGVGGASALARALGYDAMVGTSLAVLGAACGCAQSCRRPPCPRWPGTRNG